MCVYVCVGGGGVQRGYDALRVLAAGVGAHVLCKMKGLTPVNNKEAGFNLRPKHCAGLHFTVLLKPAGLQHILLSYEK